MISMKPKNSRKGYLKGGKRGSKAVPVDQNLQTSQDTEWTFREEDEGAVSFTLADTVLFCGGAADHL